LLKRKKHEDDEDGDEEADEKAVPEFSVDKKEIENQILNKTYDLSCHFSKKVAFELDAKSKVKSFVIRNSKEKSVKNGINVYVAYHNNMIYSYTYDLGNKDKQDNTFTLNKIIG
jgi:hypothetical protein